jgi:hypothetical protein
MKSGLVDGHMTLTHVAYINFSFYSISKEVCMIDIVHNPIYINCSVFNYNSKENIYGKGYMVNNHHTSLLGRTTMYMDMLFKMF